MPANPPSPRRFALATLTLFTLGICERGYRLYRFDELALPNMFPAIALGHGNAPEQYRIGIVAPVYWLSQHTHLRMSLFFPVIDTFFTLLAILCVYRRVETSTAYRQATSAKQWFAAATTVALCLYYLQWAYAYQRPTTLPAVGLIALITLLLSSANPIRSRPLTIAAILLLTLAQSFIRADVVLTLFVGLFLAAAASRTQRLSLPRTTTLTTAAAAILLAAGTQLFLARVLYPHATYAGAPLFMLLGNIAAPQSWLTFLLFLTPFFWTLHQTLRHRRNPPAQDTLAQGLLLSSLAYIALWITIGRMEEVRIFIPLGFALIPLAVDLLLHRLPPPNHAG